MTCLKTLFCPHGLDVLALIAQPDALAELLFIFFSLSVALVVFLVNINDYVATIIIKLLLATTISLISSKKLNFNHFSYVAIKTLIMLCPIEPIYNR